MNPWPPPGYPPHYPMPGGYYPAPGYYAPPPPPLTPPGYLRRERWALALGALIALVVSIAGAKAKKPAVPFHHDFHKGKDGLGISCKTCHHSVDGKKVEKACTDCHKNDSVDLPTSEDAFHDTCRSCHKKQMAKDPTLKAPTSCKGCHAG